MYQRLHRNGNRRHRIIKLLIGGAIIGGIIVFAKHIKKEIKKQMQEATTSNKPPSQKIHTQPQQGKHGQSGKNHNGNEGGPGGFDGVAW